MEEVQGQHGVGECPLPSLPSHGQGRGAAALMQPWAHLLGLELPTPPPFLLSCRRRSDGSSRT